MDRPGRIADGVRRTGGGIGDSRDEVCCSSSLSRCDTFSGRWFRRPATFWGGQERKPATELIDVQREQLLNRELAARISAGPEGRSAGASLRTVCFVLASTVSYYVATQIAWALTFPDSKVSLFFPPQAVLLCILLLVPTRHWWAYVLAAASAHFLATQQAHWPPMYALTCEAFDAVKCVSAAAGIRILIKSPLKAITLRDAILFVLIAVVLVPFGTAFWGASFTVSYGFGTHYWIEWRNLGISNAVTTVVLVPAFLLGAHHLFVRRPRALSPRRVLEAALVGACTVALGIFVFDKTPAGPNTSPALLYTPIPLLIWAALRFGLGGISVSMLIMTFQAIWGTMRGHGPFLAQTPAENATALQLFLLVTATPLMLLAVVIEEERRSKEALRESANLMGLAAEAGNLAMWVWDVSGNDVWMTERGRSLFGLEPDARLDFAATFDRVHPEDRTAREGAIEQALQTRGEYEMEYRVQQADGMARWIHGRGRCVGPDDGTGPKLFGVSMDVTARKQAEASAAQKRAELEHVARVATLGELTATLTHELQAAARRDPHQLLRRRAFARRTRARSPGGAQHAGRHLRGHRARRRSHWRAARHAQARQPGGGLDQRRREQCDPHRRAHRARRRESAQGHGPPRPVVRRPPGQG